MQLNWNLDPELINLFGTFSIRYYSICFALGLYLGFVVVKRLWLKDGWTIQDLDKLSIWVIIATVLGARIGHCLFYEPEYYLQHPLEMILPFKIANGGIQFTGFQGLASHGGIFAVFVAIVLFSRKSGLKLYSLLDKVAIGGSLTAVFIRLGNFMNSEIIGKPTEADYGVVFQRVDGLLRHPSQLYESIAYLLIFLIIYAVYNRRKFADGFVFGLFFTLLFIARFLIEYTKINQVSFEESMAFNMGQTLSIPFIIGGVIIMFLRWRKREVA